VVLYFFVGNVAHDLRTPLQAFMSEVQVLHYNIKKDCEDRSGVLELSIIQLDRICEFMTMTINRSIDFTKASSGLKLNPSIESVNFPETLSWAVGCMDKSNETVPIIIMPVPLNIRNQIFTDKQWLMENMFCLLSNAQKFTTEGEITIRCALQSIPNSESENESFSNDKASSSLSVSTEFLTTMLLIEVEDSGIGISKENRERLFKPFVQVLQLSNGYVNNSMM
jgi:signal transduction histidine kinase